LGWDMGRDRGRVGFFHELLHHTEVGDDRWLGYLVKNGKKILEDYLQKLTIVSNFFLNFLVIEAFSDIGFGTTTEIYAGNLRLRFS
jgi:hypothetical protein